tara:strand:- start:11857 stop:12951 length:1095 start_codon:yes stop_codon:yes gene_type:complete
MNKKKIFFFISSIELGGAEKQISLLIDKLKKDYNISLFTLKDKKTDYYNLDNKINRYYFKINTQVNFFIKLLNYFFFLITLRKIYFKERPDTIVSFLPIPSLLMLLSSIGFKSKKIISFRNNPKFQKMSYLLRILQFILIKNVDTIIVQSISLKNEIKRFYKKINIKVIPNFIFDFEIKKTNKKFKYIKPPNTSYILSVGKIRWQKGFDILLDSYFEVIQKKKINLYILSNSTNIDHNYYKILKKKIEKKNISKNVKILFDVENVHQWYQRSTMYILSSRYEGYPNSLIEALSNNAKVISFNCNYGPKEIIKLFKTGHLLPINTNRLTKTILNVLKKKIRFKRSRKINFNKYEKNLLNLWNKVL